MGSCTEDYRVLVCVVVSMVVIVPPIMIEAEQKRREKEEEVWRGRSYTVSMEATDS